MGLMSEDNKAQLDYIKMACNRFPAIRIQYENGLLPNSYDLVNAVAKYCFMSADTKSELAIKTIEILQRLNCTNKLRF